MGRKLVLFCCCLGFFLGQTNAKKAWQLHVRFPWQMDESQQPAKTPQPAKVTHPVKEIMAQLFEDYDYYDMMEPHRDYRHEPNRKEQHPDYDNYNYNYREHSRTTRSIEYEPEYMDNDESEENLTMERNNDNIDIITNDDLLDEDTEYPRQDNEQDMDELYTGNMEKHEDCLDQNDNPLKHTYARVVPQAAAVESPGSSQISPRFSDFSQLDFSLPKKNGIKAQLSSYQPNNIPISTVNEKLQLLEPIMKKFIYAVKSVLFTPDGIKNVVDKKIKILLHYTKGLNIILKSMVDFEKAVEKYGSANRVPKKLADQVKKNTKYLGPLLEKFNAVIEYLTTLAKQHAVKSVKKLQYLNQFRNEFKRLHYRIKEIQKNKDQVSYLPKQQFAELFPILMGAGQALATILPLLSAATSLVSALGQASTVGAGAVANVHNLGPNGRPRGHYSRSASQGHQEVLEHISRQSMHLSKQLEDVGKETNDTLKELEELEKKHEEKHDKDEKEKDEDIDDLKDLFDNNDSNETKSDSGRSKNQTEDKKEDKEDVDKDAIETGDDDNDDDEGEKKDDEGKEGKKEDEKDKDGKKKAPGNENDEDVDGKKGAENEDDEDKKGPGNDNEEDIEGKNEAGNENEEDAEDENDNEEDVGDLGDALGDPLGDEEDEEEPGNKGKGGPKSKGSPNNNIVGPDEEDEENDESAIKPENQKKPGNKPGKGAGNIDDQEEQNTTETNVDEEEEEPESEKVIGQDKKKKSIMDQLSKPGNRKNILSSIGDFPKKDRVVMKDEDKDEKEFTFE